MVRREPRPDPVRRLTVALVPIGTSRSGVTEVELDDLTPRARAIATLWTTQPMHTPCPLILESLRTLREMGADEDEVRLWWGPEAMDRPHRMVWEARDVGKRGVPVAARLELLAQRLPVGYIPVGTSRSPNLNVDVDELRDDADLLTRAQIADVLAEMGRPLSPGVIANYKSHPPAGWPQPVKYVGRTPLWSRAEIEGYARR